jgi:hypothetical protein
MQRQANSGAGPHSFTLTSAIRRFVALWRYRTLMLAMLEHLIFLPSTIAVSQSSSNGQPCRCNTASDNCCTRPTWYRVTQLKAAGAMQQVLVVSTCHNYGPFSAQPAGALSKVSVQLRNEITERSIKIFLITMLIDPTAKPNEALLHFAMLTNRKMDARCLVSTFVLQSIARRLFKIYHSILLHVDGCQTYSSDTFHGVI